MAATRVFSIKFNFDSVEPQELTVSQGDLVRAPIDAELSEEPWTLVETTAPPFSRGFVPTSYLIPYSTPRKDAGTPRSVAPPVDEQGNEEETEQERPPLAGPIHSAGLIRRLSDPRLPHQLLEALSINPPEEHLRVHPSEMALVAQPPPISETYQHLFAQHDKQFQQVMHTRQEQRKNLEDALVDLTRRIDASKLKSIEIGQNMLDITGIISGERMRWKEKLLEQTNTLRDM